MEKREIAILLSFCEKKLKKKYRDNFENTYLGISNLNYSMAETEVALFLQDKMKCFHYIVMNFVCVCC